MIIVSSIIIAFIGLSFGSFVNAWVWRTAQGIKISRGRSKCPACQHTLSYTDLIPVISYLFLRGKCRYCSQSISAQYVWVEIVCMCFFFFFWWHHDYMLTIAFVRDISVYIVLVFIFLYDLLYGYILDRITLPAIIIYSIGALIFNWQSVSSLLLGTAIGGGFFLIQYIVSKGTWIGGGDIRLGIFMGCVLGYPVIGVALFLAYLLGASISLILLATKRIDMKSTTPFGTYLTVATLITMVYGKSMLAWYLHLF